MKVNRELTDSDEISLSDIQSKIRHIFYYIIREVKKVFIIALFGGGFGIIYSLIHKTVYIADSTFVLEDEGKGGGLGQYAGLASLAGINLENGGSGLFVGENIIELYKSRSMIQKTLLSIGNFYGKKELIIDRYIVDNNLKKKWQNNGLKDLNFSRNVDDFNRAQDSIISNIVKEFNKKLLTVTKPDKKLSIIQVQMKSTDEIFAIVFVKKLVENVNAFYTQTKIKKSYQNVQILQHQADSVRSILNSSLYGVATATDAIPNANPMQTSLKVRSQKRQIDVQASSAVYSEIVKNLELSKITLRKDVPLIQLIDTPIAPLENNELSLATSLAFGFIIGGFLGIILFVFLSFFN